MSGNVLFLLPVLILLFDNIPRAPNTKIRWLKWEGRKQTYVQSPLFLFTVLKETFGVPAPNPLTFLEGWAGMYELPTFRTKW